MGKLKENLKILVDRNDDGDVYQYERLLNQEMIGARDSPLTPQFTPSLHSTHQRAQSQSQRQSHELQDMQGGSLETLKSPNRKNSSLAENPFEVLSLDEDDENGIIVSGTKDSLELDNQSDTVPMSTNYSPEDGNTSKRSGPDDNTVFRIGDVKLSFFSSRFKSQMRQILKSFLLIYSLMIVLIIGIGSLYYATLFRRGHYLKQNIHIDIIDDDQQARVIKPLVGDAVKFITRNNKDLNSKVQFDYYSSQDFAGYMSEHNLTSIADAIARKILQKEAWAYIHVPANTSDNLYQALKNGDPNVFKDSRTIHMYYQSTRDPKIVSTFIKPILSSIEHLYQESFQRRVMIPLLTEWIDASQQLSLIQDHKDALFQTIAFNYHDLRPFNDPVLAAPLTVGLIMMTIISFFQFNFFLPIHNLVSAKIHPRHYIYYRMVSSQTTYFFLALGFTSLFYIFSSEKAYFFAYWMLTYLTIAAIGGMNENMALILFVTYPPLVGFWLIFWVILNISPSFNLIETLPSFYKYGYALPIYNYLESVKVVILDSWKGELSRMVLVLVAWVAVNNLLFPFTLRFFSHRMALKMAAEAEKFDK